MTIARRTLDLPKLAINPLSDHAVLTGFRSGEREIDRAIDKCCQLQSDHLARTYWATDNGIQKAIGFYTLSIMPASAEHLSPDITFGRTGGHIPFIYLNYLGVMDELQRQGLGTILLGHALRRSALVAHTVGSFGVALHALNSPAEALYYRYGFRAVEGAGKPPFMVLPVRTLFELTQPPPSSPSTAKTDSA